MTEKDVQTLVAKLDAIIKLMVLDMTEGKDQIEQIRLLSQAGFQPKDIARSIGTTPGTVSVTLNKLKKQENKGKAIRRKV